MKKKSEKQKDLDNLKTELAKVSTVILTTFQGITVENDTKLRREVQKAGGKYQVVKNTLAERAGTGTPAEGVLKNLKGTNSIAYTHTDPVALAKALTKIAKDVPAFQFKSGVVEGRVISIAEIQQLATMPSKEELISKIMFLLNAPAQRIAIALNALPRNLAVTVNEAIKANKFSSLGFGGSSGIARRVPKSLIQKIERRNRSHVESRNDTGRNQGPDASRSVRPGEKDGRSLRRFCCCGHGCGSGRWCGGGRRSGSGGREDGILRCAHRRRRQQDQRH